LNRTDIVVNWRRRPCPGEGRGKKKKCKGNGHEKGGSGRSWKKYVMVVIKKLKGGKRRRQKKGCSAPKLNTPRIT